MHIRCKLFVSHIRLHREHYRFRKRKTIIHSYFYYHTFIPPTEIFSVISVSIIYHSFIFYAIFFHKKFHQMYSSCILIKLPVLNLSFRSNKKWVPTPTPIYTDFVSSVLVPAPSLVSALISPRSSCPYFSIIRARKSTHHSNAVFCSMSPSFQITIFHKFLNPIDIFSPKTNNNDRNRNTCHRKYCPLTGSV